MDRESGAPGTSDPAVTGADVPGDSPPTGGRFGLRVLPAGWMRGLVVTVTGLLTVFIALSDLASAWVTLLFPLTVAAVVAYHEVLERLLRPEPCDGHPSPAGTTER
jgi:hypothetical protein